MKSKYFKMILIMALASVAGIIYAGVPVRAAAEPVEQVADAKKKKAGEECKVSTECPRHHICEKVGEKNVCIVSPRPEVPPT